MLRRLLVCVLFLCASWQGFAQAPQKLTVLQPQKKWAICIGASNYKQLGALTFASKDAVDFGEALVSDYGYEASTVTVLADREGYQAPTAQAINQAIDRVLSNPDLDRGDQFVFYFSGHGAGFKSGDYLLPTDATVENREKVGISITGVLSRLTKAGLKNIVVIADACRAGDKSGFGSELIDFGRKSNVAVLLGCQPGQKSYELPKQKQGAFTFSLLRAMKNQKLADPISGALWVSELGKTVSKNVETNTQADYGANAQKPVIFADKVQDVAIAVFPRVSEQAQATADEFLKDLELQAKVGKRVTFVMSIQALLAYEEKRYADAEKIFRAIDALGDTTDLEILNYSSILIKQGKQEEAFRMIARIVGKRPWTKRLAIATLIVPLWMVGEKLYREAADHMKPSSFSDINDHISFQLHAREVVLQDSAKAVADYLKSIKPEYAKDPVASKFLQAMIDRRLGKSAQAFKALSELVASQPNSSLLEDVSVERVFAGLGTGNVENLKIAVSEGLAKFPDNIRLIYFDLQIAFSTDKKRATEKFKNAMQRLEPTDLMLELYADNWGKMGNDAVAGLDWLAKHGDRPKARAFLIAVEAVVTKSFNRPLPANVLSAFSSNAAAYEAMYAYCERLLASVEKDEAIKPEEADLFRRVWLQQLKNQLTMVEGDSSLSLRLARLLNEVDLPVVAWAYLNSDAVERKIAGHDSMAFLEQRYVASLNMGDDAFAQAIWEEIVEKGDVPERVWLRRVCELVVLGDFETAAPILKRLETSTEESFRDTVTLLRIWQTLREKGRVEAMKLAEPLRTKSISKSSANELIGIVLATELQDEEPSLKLIAQLGGIDPRILSLSQAIRQQTLPRLKGVKSEADKVFVSGLLLKPMDYPGTFWSAAQPIGDGTKLADFEGEYKFKLEKDIGIPVNITDIAFTVDAKGKVTGKMMNFDIAGTVDASGNFDASVMVNGKPTTRIYSRLPSMKLLRGEKQNLKWSQLVRFNMVQNGLLIAYYKSKFVGS